MKLTLVILLTLSVVIVTTAFPQYRAVSRRSKLKSARLDSQPSSGDKASDKIVNLSDSQVVTVASSSTPSVIATTEATKIAVTKTNTSQSATVPKVTTVPPTTTPQNSTKVTEDEDEDDSSSSEEEEDAEADIEEGDQDEDEETVADEGGEGKPLLNLKVLKLQNISPEKVSAKTQKSSAGVDAYIPGYVTDQGEVLVPIDTLERGLEYSIVPDPRTVKPARESDEDSSEEDPAEQIPVKVSPTSVIFTSKATLPNDTKSEESTAPLTASESAEEDDVKLLPQKPIESTVFLETTPLGAISATKPTGEDDEVGSRRLVGMYNPNYYMPRDYPYSPQYNYVHNGFQARRLNYPYPSNGPAMSYGGARYGALRYGSYFDEASDESTENFENTQDEYY